MKELQIENVVIKFLKGRLDISKFFCSKNRKGAV